MPSFNKRYYRKIPIGTPLRKSGHFIDFLVGVCIALPVFFLFPTLTLAPPFLELYAANLRAVPVSLYLGPLLFYYCISRYLAIRPSVSNIDYTLIAYLGTLFLSLFVSSLIGSGSFNQASVLYFQTVYPIGTYILGRAVAKNAEKTESILKGIVLTTFLFLVLYLVQTIVDGGSSFRMATITDHVGPLYNSKMKRFYSMFLLVAGGYFLSKAIFDSAASLLRVIARSSASALSFGAIFSLHSRSALLSAFLIISVIGALTFLRFRAKEVRRVTWFGAIFFICMFSVVAFVGDSALRSYMRLTDTFVGGVEIAALGEADQTRFEIFQNARSILSSSFFGIGFGMIPIGQDNAESGYLDIAVRAGWLSFLSLLFFKLLIVYSCFKGGLRLVVSKFTLDAPLNHLLTILKVFVFSTTLILVLFCNVFINLNSEPYFGLCYWLLVGFAVTFSTEVPNKYNE